MPRVGFNGGLLGGRRVTSRSLASGIWVPSEQAIAQGEGIWPATGDTRYYQLASFANTALNADTLDFGEIELYDGATKHTGITCTTNFTWTAGFSSFLVDGVANTSLRSYRDNWSTFRSAATITLDLGSVKPVTHIRVFSLFTQPRFPASFVFRGSLDNITYATIATVTVGTSFTDQGGNVFASAKVPIL